MNHLMDIAIIGVIIAFQTLAGYREISTWVPYFRLLSWPL